MCVPPPRCTVASVALVTSVLVVAIYATFSIPLAAQPLIAWFDDPWRYTEGGSVLPSEEDLSRPWQMRACRNDIEQAFIGLLNTSESRLTVTVSLSSDFPPEAAHAELLVAGGIQTRKFGNALINLFTAAQIAAFNGQFPTRFTNADQIRDFPTLHLAPDRPAWLWVRVMTMSDVGEYGGLSPGNYTLTFTASGGGVDLQREIAVTVLPVVLPTAPVLESVTYGGLDERDDKLHHTTVNQGFRRYVFSGMLVPAGLWGQPLGQYARRDPVRFQQTINWALDQYVASYVRQGLREDQILIQIYDEPKDGDGDDGANFAEVAKAIRRYRPDLKIIANPASNWERSSVTLDRCFRPLAPYVDVWMPHFTHLQDPAVMAFLRSTGKPVWFYYNVAMRSGRSEAACTGFWRQAAWWALKHNLDGIGFWSATTYYGDPWDDFDTDPKKRLDRPDAAVVFPSPAGPVATRNWEAWRETLEDAAIYKMLQIALASGVIPPERRAAAQAWLGHAPDQVLAMKEGQGGAALRKLLDEALDILAALQPAPVSQRRENIAPLARISGDGGEEADERLPLLVDGNPDTWWSPRAYRGSLLFEWDRTYRVSRIRIIKRPSAPYASPCRYHVDVLTPEGTWREVYKTYGDNGEGPYSESHQGLVEVSIELWAEPARAVRIRDMQPLWSKWISVQEVEIYGSEAE